MPPGACFARCSGPADPHVSPSLERPSMHASSIPIPTPTTPQPPLDTPPQPAWTPVPPFEDPPGGDGPPVQEPPPHH